MYQPGSVCVLDDLGTLRFSGADAGKFLQGQLSNDVSALSATALLRAGLHNPQGRTLALLWLIAADGGDVLALLPRELLDAIASQLRRYVLRAKLTISDNSAQQRIYGLAAPDACPAAAGRRIASLCGERIARCTLELGGKSAAIILDDMDLAAAAASLAGSGIVSSALFRTGAAIRQVRVLTGFITAASRKRHDGAATH